MLQIIDLRNADVKNYQFTPFTAVILRTNAQGEYTSAIEVGHIKNDKPITLYMELLRYQLAEQEIVSAITSGLDILSFVVRTTTAEKVVERVDKGYRSSGNYIAKYLRTSIIYKTDKDGKLSDVVKAHDGIKFSDTMLNLKNSKGLIFASLQYERGEIDVKQLNDKIYTVAKSVELQCNYFRHVNDRVEMFADYCEEESNPETVAAEKPKRQRKSNPETVAAAV